ncbi:tetratricopeptide repeat protein [Ancylostoma ceylanicum]|uniref:Tetratricopeptide repeat protein n=1 Tax=Ancylostoma ceylanicum TaxID=53326 RepID=A0A0D6LHI3_9BILA|nr:tetratricopeptide repeat protein [Ancylostoma ceylanicum]
MFRRVLCRVAAASAGVQLCAAGVALTDKQLAKKPECSLRMRGYLLRYRKDVHALVVSLKKLGRHGFNTSPAALNEAYETLKKYEDLSNLDVLWRLARVLTEKAFFCKCPKEKAHLLHEAKEYALKALSLEGENRCAGAHKWYAIILYRLEDVDKKADYSEEVIKHLEMAADLDKEDAYTAHLLGIAHHKKRNYAEAVAAFEKAEKIKARFSPCNLYYMGAALYAMGKKEEAIKNLIAAYRAHAHNEHEIKARSEARGMLLRLKVKPEDYEIEEY